MIATLNQNLRAKFMAAGSGFNPHEATFDLFNSFPSLRGIHPRNATRFDAPFIQEHLGVYSTGQAHAARFVLGVFNPRIYGRLFNVFEACASWDSTHRAAFVDWMENPWFP